MTTVLARPFSLNLQAFCKASGLHPELAGRLVRLGLLDVAFHQEGQPRFTLVDVARAQRIQRLRTGLGLNYTALGVVMDLLERVEALEAALGSDPHSRED